MVHWYVEVDEENVENIRDSTFNPLGWSLTSTREPMGPRASSIVSAAEHGLARLKLSIAADLLPLFKKYLRSSGRRSWTAMWTSTPPARSAIPVGISSSQPGKPTPTRLQAPASTCEPLLLSPGDEALPTCAIGDDTSPSCRATGDACGRVLFQ